MLWVGGANGVETMLWVVVQTDWRWCCGWWCERSGCDAVGDANGVEVLTEWRSRCGWWCERSGGDAVGAGANGVEMMLWVLVGTEWR
jgi:hypothetical protein